MNIYINVGKNRVYYEIDKKFYPFSLSARVRRGNAVPYSLSMARGLLFYDTELPKGFTKVSLEYLEAVCNVEEN